MQPADMPDRAGPVTPWPRPVPARLKPQGPDRLFVMTLGAVDTPLADGLFDPLADRVTLRDGTVIQNYYKKHLNIPFYAPLDKSRFPLPPSGWCSWYYYYWQITPQELLANARWIAEHLAEFGCRYVQLDDGWQGAGRGGGQNRDWTTVNQRFREPGLERLAADIRALGLVPGIWLCPHGQSNQAIARESGAFLLKPDGNSPAETWVGKYLLDPSTPQAHEYLRQLLGPLREWGYGYFKLDGQPIVLSEYAKNAEHLGGAAHGDLPAPLRAAQLYRDTLRTIRDAVGPDAYLLGCFGIPLAGVGLLHGSRTGPDVVASWEGFLTAADAVQEWNFLHNIAWYCDPDVCCLRPPLSAGTARAWATLQGLTGQALLTSDRLADLPPARVELLKRIYPATDVRPLDLFRPERPRKPIWVLKVAHLGRSYDVVGLFNFDSARVVTHHLSWTELGLVPERACHVYDFWQGTYLGAWEHGVLLEVPPADVRVLTLVPAEQRPLLISTSRHITQGWVELRALESAGTSDGPLLAGRSRLIAAEPYTLTIGLPRGAPTFSLVSATARGAAGQPVRTRWFSHQGYATVRLESAATQEVEWRLAFAPARPQSCPLDAPEELEVQQRPGTLALTWRAPACAHAGYQVALDGHPLGVAFAPRAVLSNLPAGRSCELAVRTVALDGSLSSKPARVRCTPAGTAAAPDR